MQIYIESPVSIIMAGSQKEECRKFYALDSLRKVDEVAKSLKQYRGESSKEYFRSLAVKYFIGRIKVGWETQHSIKMLGATF